MNGDATQATRPVTRVELADHVEAAFASGSVSRAGVLDAATASGARPEVIIVLQRLPEGELRSLRDLWRHLPDVPFGE